MQTTRHRNTGNQNKKVETGGNIAYIGIGGRNDYRILVENLKATDHFQDLEQVGQNNNES